MSEREPAASDSKPREPSVFERHPKATLAALVVVLLVGIEAWSFAILALYGKTGPEEYDYNRTLSGYYVFKSTPHYTFRTIRERGEDPAATLDANGFLSEAPIAVDKPPGTVRIFLMGGSALFGAGQANRYAEIHRYSEGGMIYTWRLSIAGRLQRLLEARHPGTRFEVITAAAFGRTLHQSLLYYLETVSRFAPDFVVNMDGYNDIPSILSGAPYPEQERGIGSYIALLGQQSSNRWLKDHVSVVKLFSLVQRRLSGGLSVGHAAAEQSAADLPIAADMEGAYAKRRDFYELGARRLLQIFRQYLAVLRADGTGFVFTLQPMLDRLGANKPLSAIEQQMADRFGVWHGSEEFLEDGVLILRYFFDDHLSAAFAAETEAAGFGYVDLGRAASALAPDFELYTDYCHLTPEGNEFVAQQLAEALAAQGLAPAVAP